MGRLPASGPISLIAGSIHSWHVPCTTEALRGIGWGATLDGTRCLRHIPAPIANPAMQMPLDARPAMVSGECSHSRNLLLQS